MIVNIHIPGVHTSAASGYLYSPDLNMRHLISGTWTFIPHPFLLYWEHIYYINVSASRYIHRIVTDTQSSVHNTHVIYDAPITLWDSGSSIYMMDHYMLRTVHDDQKTHKSPGRMIIKTHKSPGRIIDNPLSGFSTQRSVMRTHYFYNTHINYHWTSNGLPGGIS